MALSHRRPLSSETDGVSIYRVTGYLEADVNFDMDKLLENMKGVVLGEPGHPMILPAVFFENHVCESSDIFITIAKRVAEVEESIRNGIGTSGKGYKDPEYRDLSRTLNDCGQKLEDLKRRMNFEYRMAAILIEDTPSTCHKLKQKIKVFAEMSKNREMDVEFLPKRIESQLTLVSSTDSSTLRARAIR